MSIAAVSYRHVYGLKGDVKDNVCYLDEQNIIYPAGSNIILYNIDQRSQRFINATERSEGITAMAVSPNRRYVAVAEKGEKASVAIYDLHSLRKRKSLVASESQATEFVSLAFSPDSKYLVTQGSAPDWVLTYWTWEKAKVMASVRSTNPQNMPVYQVSFNPQDNTQVCVSGNGIFRLYRYSEGNLKQFGFQKIDAQNYLCHAWLSDDRIIVGTDASKLLLFEALELKAEYVNTFGPDKRPFSIECIVPYSKGFACSGDGGVVHLYDRSDDKDYYRKSKEIAIEGNAPLCKIKNLAISPSEEVLIGTTDTNQIYSLTLSNTEILKGEEVAFELLSQSFHHEAITGLDTCVRKPLIATCGLDRSVRIWNYVENTLELVKYFQEEAYSIALHPSGLYVLVGFSDKLRLMNLLIDDIRPFKEFTIRGCREARFSNGGHLFAAVHGNVIQIYSTYTFENIGNLKGHNGKVRSISWTADDSHIVSCGMDGAVYEWQLSTFKREGENVLKSCSYTSAVVSGDGKTIFAVGSDKTLKEIADSQIVRDIDAKDTVLTQVALSRSGRMLFTCAASGTVRSIKFPLTSPGEWQEHYAHSGSVSRMLISTDDQYLFTAGEDGCLYMFKISDREGRQLKRDKEVTYAEEILITKSDLEEKNAVMAELKTRVEELKMENEYQLRLKDMNYNEKIKELTEKFIQEMEALKIQNTVLKSEKDKEEARHDEEMVELRDRHQKELQEIEALNNQKLMSEYEKHQDLQARMLAMQESFERQLREMEQTKEQALEELTAYYESKLGEKISDLEQANEESRQQFREFDETKKQVEEDADREILDLKIKYEKKLKEEREAGLRLKGENGIMRKKFNSLQKEIDDHKGEIQKMFNEQKKLHSVIKSLEKDIAGLKKEIQERDETIQDKEKRIYDLKKKNQELEKFKFVLDYKIKELKKQIEPRENDIQTMKEQIQDMDRELERYHKENSNLELSIADVRLKLKAAEKEVQLERQKSRDAEAVARRFRTDLHEAVEHIQDPKELKESVKKLYQKHVGETEVRETGVDADIQREYNRQREYLERSVASLKHKLQKDMELHRADNIRIMHENVSLIREINDLRRELKAARQRIREYEMGTATTASGSLGPRTGPSLTQETDKLIEIQKSEIQRLRDRIREIENGFNRPSSTGRLLPMTSADVFATTERDAASPLGAAPSSPDKATLVR